MVAFMFRKIVFLTSFLALAGTGPAAWSVDKPSKTTERVVSPGPKYAPPLMDSSSESSAASSEGTYRRPRSSDGVSLNVDASIAFNPISSLITDDGGTGSRVTLTPAVLLSTELRRGFELFFGTQYGSHGVPVTINGKVMLASNSALEFPIGVGFPMRNSFLGEGAIGIFRTGLALSLPVSSLGVQNQILAKTKFSYATYLEAGALFPVTERFMMGATMKLSIGLSNAYEKNTAGVERTFVYGFAASSRFTL